MRNVPVKFGYDRCMIYQDSWRMHLWSCNFYNQVMKVGIHVFLDIHTCHDQ